jgi:signal transduction histidine kinase/ligand-binding sensor domain-containing protein/CheY-like chemotaxis protein
MQEHHQDEHAARGRLIVLLSAFLMLAAACGSNPGRVDSGPSPDDAPPASASDQGSVAMIPAHPFGARRVEFDHLSIEQGLSQSVVYAIYQDQQGFMWFGTQDGLNRYDGYEFRVFDHDPDDPDSISDNWVNAVVEDRDGVMWVGTNSGGLNRFDRARDSFVSYTHHPDDSKSLSGNCVTAIHPDPDGTLWVGTCSGYLNAFDPLQGTARIYQLKSDDADASGDSSIKAIERDPSGDLWIGFQESGLHRFDPESETFEAVSFGQAKEGGKYVEALMLDREGELWVGTDGNGVYRFDRDSGSLVSISGASQPFVNLQESKISAIWQDPAGVFWFGTHQNGLYAYQSETGKMRQFKPNPTDDFSLASGQVLEIFGDEADILWVGTFGAGVDKYDPYRAKFQLFRSEPGNPNSLNDDHIWSILEDSQAILWVGTNSGGLNRFDRKTQTWEQYTHDPENPDSIGPYGVMSIMEDDEGELWVGTYGGGVYRFIPGREAFQQYDTMDRVFAIHQDSSGRVWIAGAGGMGELDPESGEFQLIPAYTQDTNSLPVESVSSIHEDQAGLLWLGTMNAGLIEYDPDSGTFEQYLHDAEDPESLSDDIVLDVHIDAEGVLWLATFGGLNRFDPESGSFTHYRERDGLANDSLYGILEDDRGNLWMSSNYGLSKFNPETEVFTNFDASDGLQGNEFNMNAFHRSARGEMFFGGIAGFNAFFPEDVVRNPYLPPIAITDFQLFNQAVEVGEESPLKRVITLTEEIDLTYRDGFFSFEYAALHYSAPQENRYAYQMEGLDKDWIQAGARRFASYTNVPPGEYVFRVKGTNSDGVWNESGAGIAVRIAPPFWQTWWFRITFASLVLVGTVVGYRIRVRTIELKREQLARQVEEKTHELQRAMEDLQKSKEAAESANRAKSAFLANMSHELRTPLNAILGFTQLMLRPGRSDGGSTDLSVDQRDNLEVIARSGEHLLGLINEVLEMSKIEAGRLSLNNRDFDLHRLLDGLEDMFRLRAQKKGLELEFERAQDVPRYARTDEGKLRQILMNLLGNAIKFTQEGQVRLRVTRASPAPSNGAPSELQIGEAGQACCLRFDILDTGPGISEKDLEVIFDPFVQAKSVPHDHEGTGLGLSISQQFARLMDGAISASSSPGEGSTFTLEIPAAIPERPSPIEVMPRRRAVSLEQGAFPCRILIVDDKAVNRFLLEKYLSPFGFELRTASNGMEAVEIWESWEPHLIFMDMRMPVMDGYEATRRIKATTRGQATVIVALTASAMEEDREIILSEGCDAYIRKPFREEELFNVLEDQLGVTFIYEDLEARVSGHLDPGEMSTNEIFEKLAAVPQALVSDLDQAVRVGEINRIETVIDALERHDPDLAEYMLKQARAFDHDAILTFTRKVLA